MIKLKDLLFEDQTPKKGQLVKTKNGDTGKVIKLVDASPMDAGTVWIKWDWDAEDSRHEIHLNKLSWNGKAWIEK